MVETGRSRILVAVAVLSVLMLSTGNSWGVIETSEARYAEISREMYRSGDWLHPRLLNIHHYHKPPVTYWLTAAAYSLFGVNPFAARFFLVASFALQVLLVYNIARRLFLRDDVAFYSSLVYATLPIVLISVRGLTTDAYLTTFILLALYFGVSFLETRRFTFLYGMAFALGLGFLTKGPVVLVVPLLAMAGLWRHYRAAMPLKVATTSTLLFFTVGFSWFVFLVSEDGRFADYFFFRHFVERLSHAEVFARREPWYYYLPILPAVSLPWIVFFIGGLFNGHTTGNGIAKAKRMAVWWVLIPLVVFSLSSSKLVLYILPLFIGFSLVTGYFLAERISARLFWIFTAVVLLVEAALIAIPVFAGNFHTDTVLIITSALALLATLVVLLLRVSRELRLSILGVVFAVHLVLFSARFFHLNSGEVNSSSAVTTFIEQEGLRDRTIVVYDELLPSIAFHLDKEIVSVYAADRSLKRETQFEQDSRWKGYLIDSSEPDGVDELKSLLATKSVVIVKKQLPERLSVLMGGRWHRKSFEKWIVYFN